MNEVNRELISVLGVVMFEVGVILLLILLLIDEHKKKKEKDHGNSSNS